MGCRDTALRIENFALHFHKSHRFSGITRNLSVISYLHLMSREAHSVKCIEKVYFVNGRLITTNAYNLKEGEIISVRGRGRFKYICTRSETKKGRYMVVLNLYV